MENGRLPRSGVDSYLDEVGWGMVPERPEGLMTKKQRRRAEASGQARSTTHVGLRA